MSQFHYGQMLDDTHERMRHLEEDAVFRRKIVELADEVRPFVLSRSETRELENEGNVHMSVHSVLALALSSPETRARVESLARDFRINKNTDIALNAPVVLVVEKIVEAIETGAGAPAQHLHSTSVEFFPSDADLQEAVRLHITSRVQNSNCHHWKWRGQWLIKDGLAIVCKALDMDMRRLLALETPEKIEENIRLYEMRSRKASDSGGEALSELRKEMATMSEALLTGMRDLQGEVQAQRSEIAALRSDNAELRAAVMPRQGVAPAVQPLPCKEIPIPSFHAETPAGSPLQAARSLASHLREV